MSRITCNGAVDKEHRMEWEPPSLWPGLHRLPEPHCSCLVMRMHRFHQDQRKTPVGPIPTGIGPLCPFATLLTALARRHTQAVRYVRVQGRSRFGVCKGAALTATRTLIVDLLQFIAMFGTFKHSGHNTFSENDGWSAAWQHHFTVRTGRKRGRTPRSN